MVRNVEKLKNMNPKNKRMINLCSHMMNVDDLVLLTFNVFSRCRQVCLFLKRGANQNAADIENKTPLSIAVEAANADIVTL